MARLKALIRKDLLLLSRRVDSLLLYVSIGLVFGMGGAQIGSPFMASVLAGVTLTSLIAVLVLYSEEERGTLHGLLTYVGLNEVYLAKLAASLAVALPITEMVYVVGSVLASLGLAARDASVLALASCLFITISITAGIIAIHGGASTLALIGMSMSMASPVIVRIYLGAGYPELLALTAALAVLGYLASASLGVRRRASP